MVKAIKELSRLEQPDIMVFSMLNEDLQWHEVPKGPILDINTTHYENL